MGVLSPLFTLTNANMPRYVEVSMLRAVGSGWAGTFLLIIAPYEPVLTSHYSHQDHKSRPGFTQHQNAGED